MSNKIDVENKNEAFLDADEQYLVVIASCLPKRLDSTKEPILAAVAKRYPWANIYEGAGNRSPGTIKVVGDGLRRRKIILVFSQIYASKADYPQDNKAKRLAWFEEGLDAIAEIDDLKSVAFPSQIARDGGGNWSYYYMAIKEFAQTLHLKTSIQVSIYHNEMASDEQTTQISLINCVNLHSAVALESLCFAQGQDKVSVNSERLIFKPRNKKIQLNFNKLKNRIQEEKEHPHNDKSQEHLVLDEEAQMDKDTDDKPVVSAELISDDDADDIPEDIDTEQKVVQIAERSLSGFPKTTKNPDWGEQPLTDPVVDPSWSEFFQLDTIQAELKKTHNLLVKELESNGNVHRILPAFDLIFNAFRLCTYDELKVIILGQDPYPNPKHAMGLAFSVPKGERVAQSLRNIFTEIKSEYPDEYQEPNHGCLTSWAEQGVLLLNSALTLREGERNSHQSFWSSTTDKMIQQISTSTANEGRSLVFMLWGGDAKKKKHLIDCKRHLVLEAGHPSPMSIKWFKGCGHFKTCNSKLKSLGLDPIKW